MLFADFLWEAIIRKSLETIEMISPGAIAGSYDPSGGFPEWFPAKDSRKGFPVRVPTEPNI